MIATLTGKVQSVSGESCVIDVNGVGYQVFMPLPALETISRTGEPVRVFTHFHLREDGAALFGFLTPEDKAVFEKIIGVSGIGPKTALAVLGTLSGGRFAEAVHNEDHRVLTSVSGIGLKTAQRLILELKGKLVRVSGANEAGQKAGAGFDSSFGDAVDALVSLGYPQKEAVTAIETLTAAEPGLTTPELVRRALKNLGRK
ncbi:Holliday junction DNA helicase subunit RuvA [Hydrogenispora ethanolica]|jgi:Holliday junction DNA helicase RuvA|uniref:Holliday junction branch migration complex subunit RuvA n=1 Tax=Hydrogenispora ethanolica TaxID=1082276 RepID=A0A4R1R9X0_HYDET|nr:Holliday junction branch migration protein RuvA [Hydrogenispora ethanolica]TCL62182.1 Holliday junction DNA helicase subunit RuvA [Hydrogenispora ethanolica]